MPETAYVPDPRPVPYTYHPSIELGGGDGSGVGGIYTGAAPPAAPDDPTQGAIFYPDGGGPMQEWDVVGQAWV